MEFLLLSLSLNNLSTQQSWWETGQPRGLSVVVFISSFSSFWCIFRSPVSLSPFPSKDLDLIAPHCIKTWRRPYENGRKIDAPALLSSMMKGKFTSHTQQQQEVGEKCGRWRSSNKGFPKFRAFKLSQAQKTGGIRTHGKRKDNWQKRLFSKESFSSPKKSEVSEVRPRAQDGTEEI